MLNHPGLAARRQQAEGRPPGSYLAEGTGAVINLGYVRRIGLTAEIDKELEAS